MYRKKSEIIGQIQSYHREVANLYHTLYRRTENQEIKSILNELYEHEKTRERYLEKHRKVAEVMDCWLNFPCDKLSNQMSECLDNINTESDITMGELINVEMHFDNCLIKIYSILASENELTETAVNIFYYTHKKTKKEEDTLSNLLYKSGNNLHNNISASK
ncbi:MAG: hypothetical protein JXB49_31965 [Bacteroidales bacterium]|nr:hypothetical protein [Bacteroidales bacterium]